MLYAQLATQRSATGPSQKRKPSAAERARAKVRALEAEIRKSRDLPASRNRDIKIQNQQRELAVLYNQLDPGRPQRIAAENARAEQDEVVKERTRISEIEKLIRRQEASGPSLDFLSKPLRKELSILYDQVDIDKPRREAVASQRRDFERSVRERNKLQREVDQLRANGQDKTADFFAKKQKLDKLKKQSDPDNIFGVERVTVHTNYGPIQVPIRGWKSFSMEKQKAISHELALRHTREVNKGRVATKPETTIYDDEPLPPGEIEQLARIFDETVESNPAVKAAFLMRDAYLAADPKFKVYKDGFAAAKNVAKDGAKWARSNGIAFDDQTLAGSLLNGVLLDGVGDTLGQFEDSFTVGLKPSDVVASGLGAGSMFIPGGGGVGTKFASTLGKTVAKETAEFGLKQAVRQGLKAAGKELVADAGRSLGKAYGVASAPVRFAKTASRDGLGVASRQAVKNVPLVGRPLSMTKVERLQAKARAGAESAERAKNPKQLEELISNFDATGAFKNGRERERARKTWQRRAYQWTQEGEGRTVEKFYSLVRSKIDEAGQRRTTVEGLPLASWDDLARFGDNPDKVIKIAFTPSDLVHGQREVEWVPGGPKIKLEGGPVEEKGVGYRSTEGKATEHMNKADDDTLTIGLMTSHGNVLNHGKKLIPWISEIADFRNVPREELIGALNRGLAKMNKNSKTYKAISKFEKDANLTDVIHGLNLSMKDANKLAENFLTELKNVKGMEDITLEKIFDKIAVNDPAVRDAEILSPYIGTKIDPHQAKQVVDKNAMYPGLLPGDMAGILGSHDTRHLDPDLTKKIEDRLRAAGKEPTQKAVTYELAQEFMYRNSDIFKSGKLSVKMKDLEPYYPKMGDGDWYDATRQTMHAMSGASDAKSFARTSAQHWVGQMAGHHVETLRKLTGAANDIELRNKVGDLFVEYMERGMMADSRIEEIMVAIKMAMKQAYMAVKGTPMEKNVPPEIRRLFDDVMGKEARKPRSVSISPHAVSAVGVGTRAKARQERKDASQEREFPIATKYPFIE